MIQSVDQPPRRPRLRVDPDAVLHAVPSRSHTALGHSHARGASASSAMPTGHPHSPAAPHLRHESVYRTMQLELRIQSPSVKRQLEGRTSSTRLPVFSDNDQVYGSISMNPRSCPSPGRVTISLEGAFLFSRDLNTRVNGSRKKERHVFFTSSQVFNTLGGEQQQPAAPISAASFRDAFVNSVRPRRIERRPSLPSFNMAPRPIQFKFPMPRTVGQEMPPTCNISSPEEQAEVVYMVTALWEASDSCDRALVEAPIALHADADFHSLDGVDSIPKSWLELPLRTDRSKIPFQCALTLPNPASCSRLASMPYFVVFKTHPYSRGLSREISADATIAVSLLRVVTINITRPYTVISPASAPASAPPSSWNFEDHNEPPTTPTTRLLKRMVKSAPPMLNRATSRDDLRKVFSSAEKEKELPPIPPPAVSETRTLQTEMCIGFPKRPRHKIGPDEHPSLEDHAALPDGLYKGKMQLNPNMLPSIDWAGLNVKYYLDVSVLFRQDEFRARVPVRIY